MSSLFSGVSLFLTRNPYGCLSGWFVSWFPSESSKQKFPTLRQSTGSIQLGYDAYRLSHIFGNILQKVPTGKAVCLGLKEFGEDGAFLESETIRTRISWSPLRKGVLTLNYSSCGLGLSRATRGLCSCYSRYAAPPRSCYFFLVFLILSCGLFIFVGGGLWWGGFVVLQFILVLSRNLSADSNDRFDQQVCRTFEFGFVLVRIVRSKASG